MSVYQRGAVWWCDVSVSTSSGRLRARHSAGSRREALALEGRVFKALKAGTYRAEDFTVREAPSEAVQVPTPQPPPGGPVEAAPRAPAASACAEGSLGWLLKEVYKRHWVNKKSAENFFKYIVDVLCELVGEHPLSKPFGSLEAQTLVQTLRTYRTDKQRAIEEQTIEKYLLVLQAGVAKGYDWGLVPWAVSLKSVRATLRKSRERSYVITPDVERQVLDTLGAFRDTLPAGYWKTNDPQDLFVCLFDTGARVGELRQLEWNDWDLQRGCIRIPPERAKNGKVNYLLVSERMRAIHERRSRLGLVKCFDLSNDAIGNIWAHVREQLKITDPDFVPHAIRHTFGTRLYEDTGDIRLVQRVLRHADIKTTLRYEHSAEAALDEATAVVNARNAHKTGPKSPPKGSKSVSKMAMLGHTHPQVRTQRTARKGLSV